MAEETETRTAEETETPETPETPELSDLEKREQELVKQEEEEKETPPEDIEDIDLQAIKEKHQIVEKLKLKDSSIADLLDDVLTRYAGALPTLQRDSEIVAELKKAGYETPEERAELFAKLKTKAEISPTPETTEKPPETWADVRRKKLLDYVPKTDPNTGAPLSQEEKDKQLKVLEEYADSIVPATLPDDVSKLWSGTLSLRDELNWALFRLQPILEQHSEDLIPENVRSEILEHSKKFPYVYAGIVDQARKEGKNYYEAVYHYFINTTKGERIEAEKRKRWEAEREKEEAKKRAAKTESAKTVGGVKTSKSWKDMSFAEKEAELRRQEAEGE